MGGNDIFTEKLRFKEPFMYRIVEIVTWSKHHAEYRTEFLIQKHYKKWWQFKAQWNYLKENDGYSSFPVKVSRMLISNAEEYIEWQKELDLRKNIIPNNVVKYHER